MLIFSPRLDSSVAVVRLLWRMEARVIMRGKLGGIRLAGGKRARTFSSSAVVLWVKDTRLFLLPLFD